MYFFLVSLSFIDLIYSYSISPRWFQICSLGTIPYPLNLALPSFLLSTFLVDQRYPICWWCPMTAIWPFVSPWIIWLSWSKVCVLCYWWYPGLEVFCTQLLNSALFMDSHSVTPMSLIIIYVTTYHLLKLACNDTYVTGFLVTSNWELSCSISFMFLVISYGVIWTL